MDVGPTMLGADELGALAENPVAAIQAKSMTSLRLNVLLHGPRLVAPPVICPSSFTTLSLND